MLKEKCKSQSAVLIIGIIAKNKKLKIFETFNEVKTKSQLIKQRNAFKLLKLINSVSTLEKKLLDLIQSPQNLKLK